MRWQRSSLGPKRRGVMETSTLACGWPKPKHPAKDPANQSTNTTATRKAFKHVRLPDMGPSPSLSPFLRLSLSLSLALSLSLPFLLCIGSIQEVRHGRWHASNQETATWPPRQTASQALVRTTNRTASCRPLVPPLSLSLSFPPMSLKA